MTEVAVRDGAAVATQDVYGTLEAVVVGGDLAQLNPQQRMTYYIKKCEGLGLDPFSTPFEYVMLDGKLTLYANKGCAEQLRKSQQIDARIVSSDEIRDCYRVVVEVRDMVTGRSITSTAMVPLTKENGVWKTSQNGKRYKELDGTVSPLNATEYCNAVMKCETKAYRRATNALLGLGTLDESELDTIPTAKLVKVDMTTGEIVNPESKRPAQEYIDAAPTSLAADVAPPEEAPKPNGNGSRGPLICEECNKLIAAVDRRPKGGQFYSSKDIAEKSKKDYGKVLCWQCSLEAFEAKQKEGAS